MYKIIKFPSRFKERRDTKEPNYEQLHSEQLDVHHQRMVSNCTVSSSLKFFLMIVRMPVFLILYFLRAPVMVVCSMLYLPLFLLALFAWYAFPEKPQMWGGFGVISLLSFVLMYVYDLVLSWLSPHELVRTL